MGTYSKSECFLRLANPGTRAETLERVLQNVNIRIPTRLVPETPESVEMARRCKNNRFLKKFSISRNRYGLSLRDENGNNLKIKLHGKRKTPASVLLNALMRLSSVRSSRTVFDIIVSLVGVVDLRILKYILFNHNVYIYSNNEVYSTDNTSPNSSILLPASFKSTNVLHSIFYYSLRSLFDSSSLQLLKEIASISTASASKDALKYVIAPVALRDIRTYLRVSIADTSMAHRVLIFSRSKLPENLPDLCFSGEMEYNSRIFDNIHKMSLSESTEFDSSVFCSFLRHKAFRKYIYNSWKNKDFIEAMARFCNRGDYNYYFRVKGIQHQPVMDPPKDFQNYEFFKESFKNSASNNTVRMAIQYLKKHGNTPALLLYLQNNAEELISYIVDLSGSSSIAPHGIHSLIIGLVQASNPEQRVKLWQSLRKNGKDILRRVYKAFGDSSEHSPEPILYELLSGNYTFTSQEAASYINTGWEDELTVYFSKQPLEAIIGLADDWTYWFFSDVIAYNIDNIYSNDRPAQPEQLRAIVDFVMVAMQSKRDVNINKAVLLFDKLCDIKTIKLPSQENLDGKTLEESSANYISAGHIIYDSIPHKLKFIFAGKNGAFADTYCNDLIQQPEANEIIQLWHISQIYELQHTVLYDSFLCILQSSLSANREKESHNGLGSLNSLFTEEHPIESLFAISFAFPSLIKYYASEYFELFCETLNSRLSKQEAVEIACHRSKQQGDILDILSAISSPALGYGPERIKACSSSLIDSISLADLSIIIPFLLRSILSNKYLLFILFNYISAILQGSTTPAKILILAFIDPSHLVREKTLEFIRVTIPLLSGTNSSLSLLSRNVLKHISVESPEIKKILPDVIEACSDRSFVPSFFSSLRSLTFTNYLCLSSLSFILQILLDNISEFTDDVLDILIRLPHIITDKDKHRIGPLVFTKLTIFAASNSYQCGNVKSAALKFAPYSSFESYLPLISPTASLQLGEFLIAMLRVKNSAELNRQIISRILRDSPAPALIASICELPEFDEMLYRFIPLLKGLFRSNKQSERAAAERAIEHILRSSQQSEIHDDVVAFLNSCAIFADHPVRLSALKLTKYLPVIYVLRSDKHTIVRTEAYDRWKERVPHTNKALRTCYPEIFSLCLFIGHSTHRAAMDGVITDLVLKHPDWVEEYLSGSTPLSEMIQSIQEVGLSTFNIKAVTYENVCEYILLIAVKNAKMADIAIQFHIKHGSEAIFQRFCCDKTYRDTLIRNTPTEFIVKMISDVPIPEESLESEISEDIELTEDRNKVQKKGRKKKANRPTNQTHPTSLINKPHQAHKKASEKQDKAQNTLAWDAYQIHNDPIFIQYMTVPNKLQILKEKGSLHEDIIRSLPSSQECEEFMLTAPLAQARCYLSDYRTNYGTLERLFQRIFEQSTDLEQYITPENIKYIKKCSLRNIKDSRELAQLLIADESREAFEKVVELVFEKKVPQDLKREVLGYLLYSFLLKSKRSAARKAILSIYNEGGELGYLKTIIEESIC